MIEEPRVVGLERRPSQHDLDDALVIWNFHQMGHDLKQADVGIGLGSHDLGVATFAADLYHRGVFPLLVFSGANSPTTASRFPRGEAAHYRERAIQLGVPSSAIRVEPLATNTGQNIQFSRDLLKSAEAPIKNVLLISKPYMERRAFATCRKVWPGISVSCASEPLEFGDYVRAIGDAALVVNMLVGDLQRVIEYPKLGFALNQQVPTEVNDSYQRLVDAGFTSRLMTT